MIERVCEYCGNSFLTTNSKINEGKGKYCSRSCADKQHKLINNKKRETPVNRFCERCGKEFTTNQLAVDAGIRFCSRRCERNNTECICNECGKIFYIRKERAKDKRYCSRECHAINRTQTLEERFWSKVDKKGDDECWIWTGNADKQGYGRIGGGLKYDHRGLIATHVAWLIGHGSLPPADKVVMHTCDNPSCVNFLKHLKLGTHKDNSQDCINKKRHRYGSKHHNSKLTEEQVWEIRSKLQHKHTPADIAKKFDVNIHTIYRILYNRNAWKHVSV